jgi:predicted KAP-like P-loop ATPase
LEKVEEDELIRSEFADRVAKELLGWNRRNDSLVIGLNGDWGTGKTTLKNFILNCISARCKGNKLPPLAVVEFNPWRWSNQNKILEGFFNEVGSIFDSKYFPDTSKAKRLAHLWDGFAMASTTFGGLAKRIQLSVTAVFALLAGGSGVLSNYLPIGQVEPWLSVLSIGLFLIATACFFFSKVAENLVKWVNWKVNIPGLSLDEARKKLQSELKTLNAPILVVIDDIDRLTNSEMRLMVQLVKANVNFPNVIYLLLFQKEVLARALDDDSGANGMGFLDKIVQVELQVPSAPDFRMRKMLGDGLDQIWTKARFRWREEEKTRW